MVANNAIYAFDSSEAVIMLEETAPLPGVAFSNNVYYDAATSPVFAIAPAGSPWMTFAQWQATGMDRSGSLMNRSKTGRRQPVSGHGQRVIQHRIDALRPSQCTTGKWIPLIGAGMSLSSISAIPGAEFSTDLTGSAFLNAPTGAFNVGAY